MDATLFGLFGLGLLLGLKHALDADHIAAIATLNHKNDLSKGSLFFLKKQRKYC